MLSHLLIVGVSVPAIALVNVPFAIVTAVVLYVHIVTDVVWDIWLLGHQSDISAEELVQSVR